MKILITGGAGFIGSALIRFLINNTEHNVLNIDKLTYASNLSTLSSVSNNERYQFIQQDICSKEEMSNIFAEFEPNIVIHLAAESHVDNSIDSSNIFIQTNIIGTYTLLEVTRQYYNSLNESKSLFRFHHVSTDEVYGDLIETDDLFTENTAYKPSSPYSASKAASDHLVRAWHRTYNIPVVVTNCSNNYGEYQHSEKLIPLVISNALQGKKIPIYGNGQQVRDWLYVEDHARALYLVATTGKLGETYNIGGYNEISNIDIVKMICRSLDLLSPPKQNNKNFSFTSYCELIEFVNDRPGHDLRYAIDSSKITLDLGWKPKETLESGLLKTVMWSLENANLA